MLTEKLATIGATAASINFANAIYTGDSTHSIDVEPIESNGKTGYIVRVSGASVAFIEFGAGKTYGYGHPMANELGFGPGTWPDKHYRSHHDWSKGNGARVKIANWENPDGWYLPAPHPRGIHTYGNPPNAGMYNARVEIINAVRSVAKEVFDASN